MATPTVLVNGEEDQPRRPGSSQSSVRQSIQTPMPAITIEDLKRALAADLLRADIVGRPKRLRGSEAKELAEALISNLRARQSSGLVDGTSPSDEIFLFTCATWLGLSAPSGSPAAGVWNPVVSSGSGAKKIVARKFRVNRDGYDSPVDDEDEDMESEPSAIKETFDVEWELTLGGLGGKFHVKGLVLSETQGGTPANKDESPQSTTSGEDTVDFWRSRSQNWEKRYKERDEEFRDLRDRVLETVM
jgi:hypothetical protein